VAVALAPHQDHARAPVDVLQKQPRDLPSTQTHPPQQSQDRPVSQADRPRRGKAGEDPAHLRVGQRLRQRWCNRAGSDWAKTVGQATGYQLPCAHPPQQRTHRVHPDLHRPGSLCLRPDADELVYLQCFQ
jgi:hypothetical protein